MLLVPACQVCHPILRCILMKTDDRALHGGLCAPGLTDGRPHVPTTLLLHESRTPGSRTEGVVVAHTPAEAAASLSLLMRAYDLSRTVNDAGREVPGGLRRHQRCHQGRPRWTRAINCWTP